MTVHTKVKAYAVWGILALAALVLVDRGTTLDLVPNDVEKLFWASVAPLVAGGVAAFFTRERHQATAPPSEQLPTDPAVPPGV